MILHYKLLRKVFVILLISNVVTIANSIAAEKKAPPFIVSKNENFCTKDLKVRVLLDEKKGVGQWEIYAPSGIIVTDVDNNRKKNSSKCLKNSIAFKNGSLWINGKKLAQKRIRIDAIKDLLSHNEKNYQGSFLVLIENGSCLFINSIDLEDYVCSVLRSESWPGWPLEVNKVFAVASRTYVVAKILECGNKRPYHIKNTNIHQTYNGCPLIKKQASDVIEQAVALTKGLLVTHNKKPISAMFDSCCGGIIPAHLSGVNFTKSPYLARTKVCTFCKPCKIYQWQWEVDFKDFEKILQEKNYPIHGIKDIKTKKDKAGAVQEIIITSAKGVTTLTGRQFYALSTRVKSFCYSIETKFKKVLIKGRGYGHHLGLCQWGARRMIDHGWNYRNILSFSYPGTSFMKLTLK